MQSRDQNAVYIYGHNTTNRDDSHSIFKKTDLVLAIIDKR